MDSLNGSGDMVDESTVIEHVLKELVAHDESPGLDQLCEACVRVLDIDGMSIAVISGQAIRETLCARGGHALQIDQLQFTVGEGPCLEACSAGKPMSIPDLLDETDERWPVFSSAVSEIAPELRAIFGFPLLVGSQGIGAMNLYRHSPGELGEKQIREAIRACELAVPIILEDFPIQRDSEFGTYFQKYAVIDRTSVYRATGLLMLTHDLTSWEAFDRLRAFAFSQGRLVEDVAEDVVAHRIQLSDDPDSTS